MLGSRDGVGEGLRADPHVLQTRSLRDWTEGMSPPVYKRQVKQLVFNHLSSDYRTGAYFWDTDHCRIKQL